MPTRGRSTCPPLACGLSRELSAHRHGSARVGGGSGRAQQALPALAHLRCGDTCASFGISATRGSCPQGHAGGAAEPGEGHRGSCFCWWGWNRRLTSSQRELPVDAGVDAGCQESLHRRTHGGADPPSPSPPFSRCESRHREPRRICGRPPGRGYRRRCGGSSPLPVGILRCVTRRCCCRPAFTPAPVLVTIRSRRTG